MSSLNQFLDKYESALEALADDQQQPIKDKVLAVLKVRDNIQKLAVDRYEDDPDAMFKLMEMDRILKTKALEITRKVNLADWRDSYSPSDKSWWWFLDDQEVRGDPLLRFLSVALLVLIIPLAWEIIKRFWSGAPDTISILGTILTLISLASPFIKLRKRFQYPFVKFEHSSEIMIILSFVGLIALLVARLWFLPGPLATHYNNAGAAERAAGDLNQAQQYFQRAAALNPGRVVPYHNIAEAYLDAGLENQALMWFEKAIECDTNFAPAYRGLGALYNQQGRYLEAEHVLLAGLNIQSTASDEVLQQVTYYELLANLGWSYWGQGKPDLAQTVFNSALSLEEELKAMGMKNGTEYRLAIPHFYLAQIYEQAGSLDLAQLQWEECLRLLDQADWRQSERYQIAQQHLQDLIDN